MRNGKKLLAICCALILSTSQLGTSVYAVNDTTYDVKTVYSGDSSAYLKYNSLKFTDIEDATDLKAAVKVSIFRIMNGSDMKFYPKAEVSREDVIATLVKLKKVDISKYLNKTTSTKGTKVSTWANPYILAATDLKILPKTIAKGYDYTLPVCKEDFAFWLANMLGLKPDNTLLAVNGFKDSSTITEGYKPYIEQLVLKGFFYSDKEGWDNKFNPKENMTRIELARVFSDVLTCYGEDLGYNVSHAQVKDIVKSTIKIPKETEINDVYIEGQDGYYSKLNQVINKNQKSLPKNSPQDFIVFKNNIYGFSDMLQKEDYVDVYTDKDGKVIFVDASGKGIDVSNITGDIVAINQDSKGDTIEIKDKDGQYYQFKITKNTMITINNNDVRLSQLVVGQEVTVAYRDDYAINIKAYSEEVREEDESFSIIGIVDKLSYTSIRINVGGIKREYAISDDTFIYNTSKATTLDTINMGYIVKLTVNPGNTLQSINVQGLGGQVKNIIRGTVVDYNQTNESMTIGNVKVLKNGNWKDLYNQTVYNLASQSKIYSSGAVIEGEKINKYIGKEIYAVTIDNRGEDVIYKANMKLGRETYLNDKISDVNDGVGKVQLDSGNNINVDDGSIIVYNNRIVDKDILMSGSSVFVGMDQRLSGKFAGVLVADMPSINNLIDEYKFTIGKLDNFTNSTLTLSDVAEFKNNQWEKLRNANGELQTETVNINTDAAILDSTPTTGIVPITYNDLISNGYILPSTTNVTVARTVYYAYVITSNRDNQICGMYIMKGSPNLLLQRVRKAKIADFTNDTNLGILMNTTNTEEWSNNRLKWQPMPIPNTTAIPLSNAFIFKKGKIYCDLSILKGGDDPKVISGKIYEDIRNLKLGDDIFFMMDSDKDRVCIFVK